MGFATICMHMSGAHVAGEVTMSHLISMLVCHDHCH